MKLFLAVCLLVSSLLTVPAAAQEKEALPAFKVMSFNIRFGTANDGDNHWNKRHQLVIKTIKEFGPDLLGTQETLGFQAEYLKSKLPDYGFFGRSRDKDPNKGEQCSILYLKERFEKVDAGQFWLSETPDKIASKSWDSSLPRIATWIILKDKKHNDRQLVFVNTHFDHRGPKARLESAKIIRKWLEKNHSDRPVVVTGDFNCGSTSAPYKVLVNAESKFKLTDTFRTKYPKAKKDEGTFNGFRGTQTGARIDWILQANDLKTDSAAIDRFNSDGRYPSDHFPVTALLRWKK